ncbi:unnamed protein product [Heterobilharzia americana]|nr:unnamed protein product [Heterobilharzia americana]
MDIKQFRDSAELSDFTVYIDSERFKLHKFPLYTKSDYFKEIASGNPVCQISDFPGGSKTFTVIADFCYGKDINITPQNVVFLYAGAELLKMKGKENLLEISRGFIDNIFRNAYEMREVTDLICILCSAYGLKSEATKKVYEESVELLVSLWLHEENVFKTFYPAHNKAPSDCNIMHGDNQIADYLAYLPLGSLLKLIDIARNKVVDETVILSLCAKYLGRILDHYSPKDSDKGETPKSLDTSKNVKAKEVIAKETPKTCLPTFCGLNSLVKCDHQKKLEELYEENSSLSETLKNTTQQFESVFEALKKPVGLSDFINKNWIIKALEVTDSNEVKLKCRPDILKIANKMLVTLSEQDYEQLSPSVLNDIICANDIKVEKKPVEETGNLSRRSSKRPSYTEDNLDNNTSETSINRKRSIKKDKPITTGNEKNADKIETKQNVLPESVAYQIIRYMSKRADEKKLTMKEYIEFLKKIQISDSQVPLDDDFIRILKKLTDSGQVHNEEETKEILTHINLNNCTTDTLNDVLEMDLFPPKTVAEAALYVANKKQTNQLWPSNKCDYHQNVLVHI